MGMGMGNGEWGMGNEEWGMGNGEWGMGNGEWERRIKNGELGENGMENRSEQGMGNEEWRMENGEGEGDWRTKNGYWSLGNGELGMEN